MSFRDERQQYRIEKPVGTCDYARTGTINSEDLKSYTGDVVKEFWCNTLFREHKYFVKEEYDMSMMSMQYSEDGIPSKRAVRHFETTDIPTPGLQIPEVIKRGNWSDPSKINTWSDEFKETHRVGEWGIYAENYEQYTDEEMRQREEQRLKRDANERERAERQRQQAENERQQAETKRITAALEKQNLEELERSRDADISDIFRKPLAVLRLYQKEHTSLLTEFAVKSYRENPQKLEMLQKIFALEELLRDFVTADTWGAFDSKKKEISTTVQHATDAIKTYNDTMYRTFSIDGTAGTVYYENDRYGIIHTIETIWEDVQKCVFTGKCVEYDTMGPIVLFTAADIERRERNRNEGKKVNSYYSHESPFEQPAVPLDIHTDLEGRLYTVIETYNERTGMQEYVNHQIRKYEKRRASDEKNTDEYEDWAEGIFWKVLTKEDVIIKVPYIDRKLLSGGSMTAMLALLGTYAGPP
jgi:hypothetical protein